MQSIGSNQQAIYSSAPQHAEAPLQRGPITTALSNRSAVLFAVVAYCISNSLRPGHASAIVYAHSERVHRFAAHSFPRRSLWCLRGVHKHLWAYRIGVLTSHAESPGWCLNAGVRAVSVRPVNSGGVGRCQMPVRVARVASKSA